jgi:hypothetical protein
VRVGVEPEDIPLRDSPVLNKPPGRVVRPGRLRPAQVVGKFGDRRVEIEVGAPTEGGENMHAQLGRRVYGDRGDDTPANGINSGP